ncbi:MAG: pectinesterase family protein [Chthoniobacter sp.]|nr:pectinesterase family protein [Chthoniobacter sp.]
MDGNVAFVRLRTGSLQYGESYFVRMEPGVFKEFGGVATGWRFTTKAAHVKNSDRLVVAADGTGDFCTVRGAVDGIEPKRQRPVTIFVCKGRYEELVRVGPEQSHVSLVGEDRQGTIISYVNNEKLNPGWIQRAVLGVQGDDCVLENLTVQNRTPYKGSQAEAVFVSAERCTLRNATFLSFQDTLNVSGSVHVHDCLIEGDVDYVWGYGSALFERCELRSMHDGYIVQARNPPGKPGYVFVNCRLTAAPEVRRCWLARIEADRFPASQVAFVRCQMGPHILAAGWQATGSAKGDLRFGEFLSTDLAGQPLKVSARDVSGRQLSAEEAKELSRAPFR